MRYEKNKNVQNVDDIYTKLLKPNEKFSSKITVLVCDNVWELWRFVREFPTAAELNPSLKSFYLRI